MMSLMTEVPQKVGGFSGLVKRAKCALFIVSGCIRQVGKIMMIQVWVFIDYPGMAKKHDFGSFYTGWASTSYNCGYNPLNWPFE